jgi:sodium/bile acid cotransporter 7
LRALLARLKPDLYVVLILSVMALATLAPVRGEAATAVGWATKVGVGLVFFLHGAKLSGDAVVRGLTHWRLHLLVLATTFGLFPVLGLTIAAFPDAITPPALAPGIILLCCLPSTVQSSISFTAVARGDVAAAVASATASNLLGMAITPLLAALLLNGSGGGMSAHSIQSIALQLLAPFGAGQLLRRWIGPWIRTQARVLAWTDRGAILLVIYSAFSAAVTAGLWHEVSGLDLARLLVICVGLLALVLTFTTMVARGLRFSRADEIVIVFCGSKKSLASGAPMASALFPAAVVGPMILPLMLFHQLQLMACAAIAQRYAARPDAEG